MRKVDRPTPEKVDIQPYSDQDIRAILSRLERSLPYRRTYSETSHFLKFPLCHKTMLYLLLDTGIRASELCRIKLNHVDLKNRNIYILGEWDNDRYVPFSPRTGQVLWQHITTERSDASANQPLFVTSNGNAFKHSMLFERITDICKRVGGSKPTLHRFRHTFAINFLRNSGNI